MSKEIEDLFHWFQYNSMHKCTLGAYIINTEKI